MNSFVLNSRHIEALKADINVRNSYINELESKVDQQQSTLRLLAEAVLRDHRCSLYVTDDGDREPLYCLTDKGESCKYGHGDKCNKYNKCPCEACKLAREIAEVGND